MLLFEAQQRTPGSWGNRCFLAEGEKPLGVLEKLASPQGASLHFKIIMLLTFWRLRVPIFDGVWVTGVVICKMPWLC